MFEEGQETPESQTASGQGHTQTPGGDGGTRENNSGEPAWLPERLERAKRSVVKTLLDEMGIQDVETLKTLAGEWKTRSEKEKSDLQKAQETLQKLQADLNTAKAEALRAKVAAKHKLPPALAERLRGAMEEEMEADAKALLEQLPKPGGNVSPANPGGGVALTLEDIKRMSPEEINRRWDEVKRVMGTK